MSSSSSIGDFNLNFVKLRKPLEFADGTIQDTAYTGDGSEDLAEVLAVGNNALGQDIIGVADLIVDNVVVNSVIEFPDGTIQDTAYIPLPSLIYNNLNVTTTALTDPAINPTTTINIHDFSNLSAGVYSISLYWDLENNQSNTIVYQNVIITAQQSGITTFPRFYYPDVSLSGDGSSLESNSVFQLTMAENQGLVLRFSATASSGIYDGSGQAVNFKVNYINAVKLTNTITP